MPSAPCSHCRAVRSKRVTSLTTAFQCVACPVGARALHAGAPATKVTELASPTCAYSPQQPAVPLCWKSSVFCFNSCVYWHATSFLPRLVSSHLDSYWSNQIVSHSSVLFSKKTSKQNKLLSDKEPCKTMQSTASGDSYYVPSDNKHHIRPRVSWLGDPLCDSVRSR